MGRERGIPIFSNDVATGGMSVDMPGHRDESRHARNSTESKKHITGGGSVETKVAEPETLKTRKLNPSELTDELVSEAIDAALAEGASEGESKADKSRRLKEQTSAYGIALPRFSVAAYRKALEEKIRSGEISLEVPILPEKPVTETVVAEPTDVAEKMIRVGGTDEDPIMVPESKFKFKTKEQPANKKIESDPRLKDKKERNYDHIEAILNKPSARVTKEDIDILHNAKTDQNLVSTQPDTWMKVISDLRGRYMSKTDDRSRRVYENLNTGLIGERFQRLLDEKKKTQKPVEMPAVESPMKGNLTYNKAELLKRVNGGALTMRELRQAFTDAREHRDTDVALAALDKAESIYAKDILATSNADAREKIAFKIREIHADRNAIRRATKIIEPPVPRVETIAAQPTEPTEVTASGAVATEFQPAESDERQGLKAKFEEYNDELKAVEESLKTSPKNKKLKNRQLELLALCAEIYNKLNPPKEKVKKPASKNNNVDTGKNRGGDHQMDDYEIMKIRDRLKSSKIPKTETPPTVETSLSPERQREVQLKITAEKLIDKNLETQMDGFGMTEEEKAGQRNTPFYKRKRQEAINALLEKIKPRL